MSTESSAIDYTTTLEDRKRVLDARECGRPRTAKVSDIGVFISHQHNAAQPL